MAALSMTKTNKDLVHAGLRDVIEDRLGALRKIDQHWFTLARLKLIATEKVF